MISKFFIDRPVFSVVLSLVIVIAGTVSILRLPIERYPQTVPPTILITAVYPGADAQTLAESVAAPIEQQLSGIHGLIYYSSQNANDGTCTITATFELGTDQDIAAVEVQNRLSIAEPKLPAEVTRQGVTVTKSSSSILGVAAVESKDGQFNDLYLSNFATINLLDRIKRVPGIGDANVFGNKDYAMRIWIDPDRLALKSLTVSDVAAKLRDQNAVFPAGTIGQRPHGKEVELTLPVLTRGRLSEVSEYENVILRANSDGDIVRLKDVARIELGANSYNLFGRLQGKPTALVVVSLQNGANALDAMDGVKAELAEAAKTFPAGVTWSIPYDTTTFVRVSIHEVIETLFEAVGLVILIVFIFLQSWRATLIPLLAVPVAIIGTFAGMLLMGFSINTLTLFGLVLAIGIVVDDAIIVVESVERLMHDEKLPVYEATVKAMNQVTVALIAIVLALCAIFVPVAFLGGFTGAMYKQFAVTIALSVVISGFVAITLSPALCNILLKSETSEKNALARGFDRVFGWITDGYSACVRTAIRGSIVTLLVFGVLLFGVYRLYRSTPSGFLPDEDQGFVIAVAMLPDGSSLDKTQHVMQQAEDFFMHQPAVANVVVLGGYDLLAGGATSSNTGVMFISLKPFDERKGPGMAAQDVINASRALMGSVKEGIVLALNPPAIQGLGNRSGFTVEIQQRGGGTIAELAAVGDKFMAAARQDPTLSQLNSTLRVTLPQVYVDLNREKTQIMGVNIADVFDPLQAYFGALYVNDFNNFGRVWHVQVQAEPQFRDRPQDIRDIYVRNENKDMVPLSAVVDMKFRAGPNVASRFNGYPSIEITGAPAEGKSSGEATNAIRDLAAKELPPGYSIDWSGATYQEIKSGNQAPIVLAFGMLLVFLVHAAEYERFTLPLGVLLSIPIAVFGAVLAIWLRSYPMDIYFQIGLLVLVGLAAKNSVLIIEYCLHLRLSNESIIDSAVEGAKLRFRPIVMTSLAFILGVVPLAIATGAGAAGRRSIGTGVVGGMLASTCLGVFFVPIFFVILQRISEYFSKPRVDRQVPMKNDLNASITHEQPAGQSYST